MSNTPKPAKDYLASHSITSLRSMTSKSSSMPRANISASTRSDLEQFHPVRARFAETGQGIGRKDISRPETARHSQYRAKAVTSVCSLGVDYLTVHTQGGTEMMKAAAKGCCRCTLERTQGTENHRRGPVADEHLGRCPAQRAGRRRNRSSTMFRHCAAMAAASGLDGIVCSASDLPSCTKTCLQGSR